MKYLIILISTLFTNLTFGQLVSPTFFDICIYISENDKYYDKISKFYNKYNDEDTFSLTKGIHERLTEPRKAVIYFTEYKKNNKQIALYFSMPFKQKDNELEMEMVLVNDIQFDITDIENGTYFIDYSKDLYSIPASYETKPTGEGLLIINIPSKTLNKCKISNEFIPNENYSESDN